MPPALQHCITALLISAFSMTAQTTVPPRLTHQWRVIANLPPGTPILVQETYNPTPRPAP